jgi:hypothetical protein
VTLNLTLISRTGAYQCSDFQLSYLNKRTRRYEPLTHIAVKGHVKVPAGGH